MAKWSCLTATWSELSRAKRSVVSGDCARRGSRHAAGHMHDNIIAPNDNDYHCYCHCSQRVTDVRVAGAEDADELLLCALVIVSG